MEDRFSGGCGSRATASVVAARRTAQTDGQTMLRVATLSSFYLLALAVFIAAYSVIPS